MKKIILFCCFCFIVINIIGCEGPAGPAGPVGRQDYSVFGALEFAADTLPTNAYIILSNISSLPTVKLNQNSIKFRSMNSSGSYYRDNLNNLIGGDEVQLAISGDQGTAGAVVRIPQQFTIQSPDPDSIFILPPHSNFTASWTASSFSDYYLIYFDLNYSYFPIGGGTSKYFGFLVDTLISTTSITIPASRLFPADFDSVVGWSYGHFEIIAINGPRLEVGAQGNVTGEGIGFFFGKTYGDRIEINLDNSARVDSETKLKSDFKREQSERFYKKFLKWQNMRD